ncbi:MAG: cobyric acid synthase [Pseudomonadales bacterium]
MTFTLMVQGTTSDAGKTVLVAGLCRVLADRGVAVAPFKPQNMALNSAVTADGGEIGRAQALQAQACRVDPVVDMNPILLKPSSDTGAQVIVQGKALSDMEAGAYHDYKAVAKTAVLESYTRLAEQYDAIIVEGAGSPAEINLRHNDIANMGFAEAVDCPVIIVADIDRGGVFAHLVGTLDLLSESEQNRVIGFVINRFRGDIKLLEPGLDWLEQRTGKVVFGVVPYLQGLHLDAEDAISQVQDINDSDKAFTVIVPVLSRISNHTDFDPLRLHPQINLQYIGPGQPIPAADFIIIPGTKNVRLDRQWLTDNGWDSAIRKHLRYGGKVLGICGGYQLLGEDIADPGGVEGTAGLSKGLALLPVNTLLEETKQLSQVKAKLLDSASFVNAYEIHCGQTEVLSKRRVFAKLDDGRVDGMISEDNMVAGTYLHGVFDSPEAAGRILQWAGCSQMETIDIDAIREQQLDRLADCLTESLDCRKLFASLENQGRRCAD